MKALLKDKLVSKFKSDPEYRRNYLAGYLRSRVAMQIAATRNERGLSQAQLAEMCETQQPAISRIESLEQGRFWRFDTLITAADEMGVAIDVSVVPYRQIVENAIAVGWQAPLGVDVDPYFTGVVEETAEERLRSEIAAWTRDPARDSTGKLVEWLQGRDLPARESDVPAHQIIAAAVAGDDGLETKVAERLSDVLAGINSGVLFEQARRPADLLVNALWLARDIARPAKLKRAIVELYNSRGTGQLWWSTEAFAALEAAYGANARYSQELEGLELERLSTDQMARRVDAISATFVNEFGIELAFQQIVVSEVAETTVVAQFKARIKDYMSPEALSQKGIRRFVEGMYEHAQARQPVSR